MEMQLEDLKQQLEKQCMINQELQRQNKDLGEHSHNNITLKGDSAPDLVWRKGTVQHVQHLSIYSGDWSDVRV